MLSHEKSGKTSRLISRRMICVISARSVGDNSPETLGCGCGQNRNAAAKISARIAKPMSVRLRMARSRPPNDQAQRPGACDRRYDRDGIAGFAGGHLKSGQPEDADS